MTKKSSTYVKSKLEKYEKVHLKPKKNTDPEVGVGVGVGVSALEKGLKEFATAAGITAVTALTPDKALGEFKPHKQLSGAWMSDAMSDPKIHAAVSDLHNNGIIPVIHLDKNTGESRLSLHDQKTKAPIAHISDSVDGGYHMPTQNISGSKFRTIRNHIGKISDHFIGFLQKITSQKSEALAKNGKNPKQIAAIGVIKGDHILLGKRNDSGKWTQPGGHIDPHETPEQGALRELKEEAGITPDKLHYVTTQNCTNPRGEPLTIHAFVCFGDYNHTAENDPDKECTKWEWVDTSKGLPNDVASNLHAPKNVVLGALGLLPKPDKP